MKRRRALPDKESRLATDFLMFISASGILHRDGAMTMSRLSKAVNPSKHSRPEIDWMVANGYVDRFHDTEDRRVVHVRLTDSGYKLLLESKNN